MTSLPVAFESRAVLWKPAVASFGGGDWDHYGAGSHSVCFFHWSTVIHVFKKANFTEKTLKKSFNPHATDFKCCFVVPWINDILKTQDWKKPWIWNWPEDGFSSRGVVHQKNRFCGNRWLRVSVGIWIRFHVLKGVLTMRPRLVPEQWTGMSSSEF